MQNAPDCLSNSLHDSRHASMRILLTEDDPALSDLLMRACRQEGYSVDWVSDGVAAYRALVTGRYDDLVLGQGLPHIDGKVISNQALTSAITILDATVVLNALEVYIHRLRKKLEPAGITIRT